jgi:hypothetical protein
VAGATTPRAARAGEEIAKRRAIRRERVEMRMERIVFAQRKM